MITNKKRERGRPKSFDDKEIRAALAYFEAGEQKISDRQKQNLAYANRTLELLKKHNLIYEHHKWLYDASKRFNTTRWCQTGILAELGRFEKEEDILFFANVSRVWKAELQVPSSEIVSILRKWRKTYGDKLEKEKIFDHLTDLISSDELVKKWQRTASQYLSVLPNEDKGKIGANALRKYSGRKKP